MPNLADTMLRHPVGQDDNQDARQALADDLARAQAELAALDQMLKLNGWAIVKSKLQAEEMDLLAKMEMSQDPTTLAKLVGSLLANKAQQTWPERRMADLQQVLADLSTP